MAGVDKIIKQIMDKAEAEAAEVIRQAKAEADEIAAQARADASVKSEQSAKHLRNEKQSVDKRTQSAIDLTRRQALLAAKQEEIASILDAAYQKMAEQETNAYFAMLAKILAQNVQAQDGKMVLCARDRANMPSDFVQTVSRIAKDKGGSLTIDEKAGNIENGFLLIYGDIEENCTLRAIFEARKDELVDIVHGIIS